MSNAYTPGGCGHLMLARLEEGPAEPREPIVDARDPKPGAPLSRTEGAELFGKLADLHRAGVLERRGLRQYIDRGTDWLRDVGQRMAGRLHGFAATLSGAVDRDRREAADAQRRDQLAAERAREAAQERQHARDREQVAERFRTIAARREAGAYGYSDQSSDWRATPEALRRAVDAYNGANQHTKDLYIERIQREPQMARAVDQQLRDRELVLQRDRGLSR